MTTIDERDWEDYRIWIQDQILKFNNRNYSLLMNKLHNIPFAWVMDRDRNRAGDGLSMVRRHFPGYGRFSVSLRKRHCSVLEMLTAIAMRMDNEWVGTPGKNRSGEFFWELIKNLKLNEFDNYSFGMRVNDVEQIVDDWMYRRIGYKGEGGIFPLDYASRDQRDIEIWSQMMEYITENY